MAARNLAMSSNILLGEEKSWKFLIFFYGLL